MRSAGVRAAVPVTGATALILLFGACSGNDTVDGPAALPADRVVFALGSTGHGWTSFAAQQIRSPVLVVHGDGRVVYSTSAMNDGPAASMAPPEYRVAHIDPLDVAEFAYDLEQQNLVDLGTDVGVPGVTDQATTTVHLHAYGPSTDLRVYAFSPRFENGLSADALANRAALREAIEDAWEFTHGDSEPYVPQRVTVYGMSGSDSPPGDAPEWPGPAPETFLTGTGGRVTRGEITGDAAAVVYAAARENPNAHWTIGTGVMRLVVDPVP